MQQKILIVGLFLSESNKDKILRTPADQLAESLEKFGYTIIRTSTYVNRLLRLLHTILTILFNANKFTVAIVPLYGGFRSYVWEECTAFLLQKLRKKIIFVAHGGELPVRIKLKPKRYLKTLQRATAIVCPSPYLKKEIDLYGFNCLLIENIIETQQYQFHKKEILKPYFFWMRTFEHYYNPIMAVQVLAKVKEKYPEAKMVMAGYDRGMLQQTKTAAKQLQVFNDILFEGYIDLNKKNYYASCYDIYLCTNTVDNAPISLIEMQALGLPIVTTNAGGIPYLISHKKNGLMSNVHDVEAMVSNIDYLLSNVPKAIEMISIAKQQTQNYAEETVVSKWHQLLLQLA